MKFSYTHITKDYTEITEYKVDKNNKIKSKILKKWQIICSVYHLFSANTIQP